MRNRLFKLFLGVFVLLSSSVLGQKAKEKNTYCRLSTDSGSCIILLYNQTPLYRDNFKKLATEGFYDSLLFHRVIQNFMIQGGDPLSKSAAAGQPLGVGDIGYTIPADFNEELIHKKGAVAAARNNNPEKASSGCQFYIVQGTVVSEERLTEMEHATGLKYTDRQREIYTVIGGTPHLDGNYTVFGEIVVGLEMVDKITSVKTTQGNRPVEDIRMKIEVLGPKEAKKLEKELNKKNRHP